MKRFAIGQKWRNDNAMQGPVFGEVIEISAQGERGTVVITDDRGNMLIPSSGLLRVSRLPASGN